MATPDASVNRAGDFSTKRGMDVTPSDISGDDFEIEADGLNEMRDIAPRVPIGGVSEDMKRNERQMREKIEAERESLKSATGPSTLGQEAGRRLVNPMVDTPSSVSTDWPVDE